MTTGEGEARLSPREYAFREIRGKAGEGTRLADILSEYGIKKSEAEIAAMEKLVVERGEIDRKLFDDVFDQCQIQIASNGHIQT